MRIRIFCLYLWIKKSFILNLQITKKIISQYLKLKKKINFSFPKSTYFFSILTDVVVVTGAQASFFQKIFRTLISGYNFVYFLFFNFQKKTTFLFYRIVRYIINWNAVYIYTINILTTILYNLNDLQTTATSSQNRLMLFFTYNQTNSVFDLMQRHCNQIN